MKGTEGKGIERRAGLDKGASVSDKSDKISINKRNANFSREGFELRIFELLHSPHGTREEYLYC